MFESLIDREQYRESFNSFRFIELSVKMGRIDELVKWYGRLASENRKNSFYAVMSVISEQHRDLSTARSAIIKYKNIIENFGEIAAAYYGLGLAFEYESDFDKSRSFYEKCIQLDYNFFLLI